MIGYAVVCPQRYGRTNVHALHATPLCAALKSSSTNKEHYGAAEYKETETFDSHMSFWHLLTKCSKCWPKKDEGTMPVPL
jgi:type II secretory pathway component PulK